LRRRRAAPQSDGWARTLRGVPLPARAVAALGRRVPAAQACVVCRDGRAGGRLSRGAAGGGSPYRHPARRAGRRDGSRLARARCWLSLQLDDELSGFERHLLGAHMRRCEDCCAYEVGLGVASAVLRTEPLEPLERPVLLPPAHSRFRVVRLTASAAAAAFV